MRILSGNEKAVNLLIEHDGQYYLRDGKHGIWSIHDGKWFTGVGNQEELEDLYQEEAFQIHTTNGCQWGWNKRHTLDILMESFVCFDWEGNSLSGKVYTMDKKFLVEIDPDRKEMKITNVYSNKVHYLYAK